MTEVGVATQTVDPHVSRRKFDREIEEFRDAAADYGKRGWFLAEAVFPQAVVLLSPPQLDPPALITAVKFDYTDYDARPPSVSLINPFTREPWEAGTLPTTLRRSIEVAPQLPPGLELPPGAALQRMIQEQTLIQSYPDERPFLCLAGVREYHDHPAHSGDPWELHRQAGAGRLIRILEILDAYGLRPINGYNVTLVPKVIGFVQGPPPT
jgi:hypothetical protein